MDSGKKISVIVPCFNEEEGLETFHQTLIRFLPDQYHYEIIYVNDGSTDRTLQVILNLTGNNPAIRYISLSRNFGHQNALKAGYDFASGY